MPLLTGSMDGASVPNKTTHWVCPACGFAYTEHQRQEFGPTVECLRCRQHELKDFIPIDLDALICL
jgi:predicted RNA-binding Zn-ribbon protein involved in translation (DUF1610 family)